MPRQTDMLKQTDMHDSEILSDVVTKYVSSKSFVSVKIIHDHALKRYRHLQLIVGE